MLNLVLSAECIWWFSGWGVQLVGTWSGTDGMPILMSLKWTSDRSLNGSPILNRIILSVSASIDDIQEEGVDHGLAMQ